MKAFKNYSFLFVMVASAMVHTAFSQTTGINGTTCVTPGTSYMYTLYSTNSTTADIQWCVTNGTINSTVTNACVHGINLTIVGVSWNGTAPATLSVTSPAYNGSFTATISGALNRGLITANKTQTINYNITPATINCAVASGGGCPPITYAYQWQSSFSGTNWADISGATTQNLGFSTPLTQPTYYRRQVTSSNNEVKYSDTATVLVNPPPIIPGPSTPTKQLTNTYTGAPFSMVTQPASLATCSDGTCFSYQWQKSTNGTTWTDIAGETALYYNPGNYQPTTTPYFRTKITANGQTAYSNTDTILSQSSIINGPADCWIGQTATYYITGFTPSQCTWGVPTGGQIIGNYQGVASVTIKWITGDVTYTINVNVNGTYYTLQVYAHIKPLKPGQIGKPTQSVETTASLSVDVFGGATGGTCNGNFTYQWQQSTDSVTYTNITGQTGASLTITPTQNVYYRRQVTCSGTYYSDTTHVILYPYFSPGNISAGNTDSIGWNTTPAQLTGTYPTGGIDSIYRYQWEYSTDGVNYNEVPFAAQGQNYQPGVLTQTTFYRRRVTNGVTTRYTNAAAVLVKIVRFTAGSISPYTQVINAGASPALTGTAATGGTVATYAYQWEKSYDETAWAAISGATSQNYSPGALTRTTYYRRYVTNGAQSGYSSVAGAFNFLKVKVLPGTGGAITPTTTTQATADGSVTAEAIDAYALPSITNAKINYVRTWAVEKPGITTPTAAKALTSANDVDRVTAYFDDLGRPIQSVAKNASPSGKDLISGVVNYDVLGRVVQEYLPYAEGTLGDFKSNAASKQPAFYNGYFAGTEAFYYSNNVYEKSPLNRVVKKTAPGKSFAGSNVGVRTDYGFNTATDTVKIWGIGTNLTDVPWVSADYAAGSLVLVVTTDEHENKVMEYKDKEGKVVLKKVQLSDTLYNGHQGWLCTYYVYDVFGRLRYVLSPKAVQYAVVNSWTLSQTVRDELCFRYAYDAEGRMIVKKVPGAGEVWMVYDGRDRLVMTQDSVQRLQGAWLYTQYDSLNRAVLTGTWTNGSDRWYHQGQAGGSVSYPSPSSGNKVLTESYFDNYGWVSGSGSGLSSSLITTNTTNTSYFYTPSNTTYPYPQAIASDVQSQGLPTGTKMNVIGTTTYLYSVPFYDDDGRMQQVHSTNYGGSKDTITNQYDFTGRLLRTLVAHAKGGTNPQDYRVVTKNDYDAAGRLVKVTKQTAGGPDVVVADNVYDELGRLAKKSLGRQRDAGGVYTANPIDSLRYTYNIRGWLRGINKDYARAENGAVNWFGMELAYDFGFSAAQLNGNIAGMRWRSSGGEQRAYGFGYDNVNRLLKGDFTQYTSGWNTNAGIDFSMKMGNGSSPYSAYDANGNILSMNQKGWAVTGSKTIDSLLYTYTANTNKLLNVIDRVNDTATKLGDFRSSKAYMTALSNNKTTAATDYSYDGNGSLLKDLNKDIGSSTATGIYYNYLNLPDSIVIAGKGSIKYTYDAAGNKLKKTVHESGKPDAVTLYLFGNYQNDTLQFLPQEEGRIRYSTISGGFVYDYFVKDHLGNVRMVLTDEQKTDAYPAATMETATIGTEDNYYGNLTNTQYAKPSWFSDPLYSTNAQVARVKNSGSTQKVGPNILLKVMAGDSYNIRVASGWNSGLTPTNSPTEVLNDLVTALSANLAGLSSGKATQAQLQNAGSGLSSGITSFLSTQSNSGAPKAYINWVLFDEQFKYYAGGFDQVGASGVTTIHVKNGLSVTKSGYLYVYTSNEATNIDVFFDNLQVTHVRGPLVQEQSYYPFGLEMRSLSSTAAANFGSAGTQKLKYNGKEEQRQEFGDGNGLEWLDYGARMYDAQIGRWHVVDPLAEKYNSLTSYAYVADNPIIYNDPTGKSGELTINAKKKEVTVQSNIIIYGHDASPQLAKKLAKSIAKQWNNAHGTTEIGGIVYKVKFKITGEYRDTRTVFDALGLVNEITNNKSYKNNYIRVQGETKEGVSYMNPHENGIAGANTGVWKFSNVSYANSTTEAHEYGHSIGLFPGTPDEHYVGGDLRGRGQPGIMAARGFLVDPQYQYNPSAIAGDTNHGGTVNPDTRAVLKDDVNQLGIGGLLTMGITHLGQLTNQYNSAND